MFGANGGILIAVTEQNPDNDEYQNGAQASATQFGRSIPCNKSSEQIIHSVLEFLR
jgi:hypothetical protein